MSKFFLFALVWWLVGNPFLAIVIVLVLLYLADRRFIGLLPSVTRPFSRSRRLSRIRSRLAMSPHDTSLKLEAARIYIEKKRYKEAAAFLEAIRPQYTHSAEVSYALGLCRLKLGRLEEGERLIREALEINPRVAYGEPYLRLAEAFAAADKDRAVRALERFGEAYSSSCEAYYRLGKLYAQLGRPEQARRAFREALHIYRGLPRYKRRSERRWALLALLRPH